MNLQILIFSFNRALQLDTLLSSIKEQWIQPDYNIDVLYNSSNQTFQEGYELLIKKYSTDSSVSFHKENSFHKKYSLSDFLNIKNVVRYLRNTRTLTPKSNFRFLCNSLLENNPSKFVMFLTDDAMFIKTVDLSEALFSWLAEKPCNRQYSLRVGLGMNGQNNTVINREHSLFWHFDENQGNSNWGYPFSVDAHIYSKNIVLSLFKKYIFCNPNTLEATINTEVRRKHLFNEGMGGITTSLLSFPINMVQHVVANESLGVNCEELNSLFLDGYTMKYPIPDKITEFQQYPHVLYLKKGSDSKVLTINQK